MYLLLVISPVILLLPYYFIWFYQKISMGKISNYITNIKSDLNIKEFNLLLPLIIFNTILGIKPKIFINILMNSIK
jgi:NADH:ubiquinone oxidoreductase subunit 4 (subunit M)